MRRIKTIRSHAMAVGVFILAFGGTARAQCTGDCDGNGSVAINELIRGVNISLGNAAISTCTAMDGDGNGSVAINELIRAVTYSLNGCPNTCGDCSDGDPCTTDVCDNGRCVNDPVVCEDDGNECTAEACDAVSGCGSTNVDDGTSCSGGGGSCQGGACVAFECVGAGDCEDGDACTTDSCVANSCSYDAVVCEDDGNECTVAACDPSSGCGSTNVDDGTSCNGGAGTCQSGVCEPPAQIEYQQDFESLDRMSESALADDGWVVFGNVFDATGVYKYGYGVFPAPNGGAAFCAIDTGQGGPEQGDQQLSIYDDYNNADHAKGDLIESNVFRERTITAGDVGKTLRFRFDAKRGNINDPADELCPCTSTAFAFIKTLNPAAGFATTNLVREETTAIPDTWNRYTLTLEIDAGLVGQLLQFGFQANATLYQPSGVLYDNLVVSSTGGTTADSDGDGFCVPNGIDDNADGDCDDAGENTADVDCNDGDATSFPQVAEVLCADGADNDCDGAADAADSDCAAVGGELTINGDFETGDITGWTDFSAANNGTFAATMAQANGGAWSGNLVASVPGGGGPTSFPVVKQANIGLGTVTPNSSITISFDLFGSQAGIGGVVFAEFFSEMTGGGTSKSEILSGGPLFPNPPNDWTADWVTYSFTTTTGPDVSGGVTLQLKADCGANAGCIVDVYFDNVSVTVP